MATIKAQPKWKRKCQICEITNICLLKPLGFFRARQLQFFCLESVAAAGVFSTLKRRKNQNSKPLENPDYTQFMALEGKWDAAGICYFPLE